MRFSFSARGKKAAIEAEEMKGLMRGIGLAFRGRSTGNLIFRFSPPSRTAITSFLVFFPFLAVWLDEKRRMIDFHIFEPFEMSRKPQRKAAWLVEMPLNEKNMATILKMGFPVGKERFK